MNERRAEPLHEYLSRAGPKWSTFQLSRWRWWCSRNEILIEKSDYTRISPLSRELAETFVLALLMESLLHQLENWLHTQANTLLGWRYVVTVGREEISFRLFLVFLTFRWTGNFSLSPRWRSHRIWHKMERGANSEKETFRSPQSFFFYEWNSLKCFGEMR